MAVIELRSTVNTDHILAIFPAPLNDFRAWDYSDKAISPYVAFADCMGDYPTRHTPYGVMTSERIEEFLYALALYLKEKGANPVIADMWPRKPDPVKLMRFHELKYAEGKTTYFSEHGETSKAAKYKNDRRWREVPPWALGDNSAGQIYGLMQHGWHNSLYQLVFMRQCWRTLPSFRLDPIFLPHGLKERENALFRLLDCCQSHIDAFKATTDANKDLEFYESEYKGK